MENLDYSNLYEKSPLGVVIIDAQGVVRWLNPVAKGIFGPTTREGRTMLQSKDWPQFREYLTAGKTFYYLINEQGLVFVPQFLDESRQTLLLWLFPSASLELDLVAMQQDLIQQRKLANLGRMMTEMAHELNNPLAGISMGTQLMELSFKRLRQLLLNPAENQAQVLETLDKLDLELNKINQSTARAAGLRQELLTFSKPNVLNLKPAPTGKLIQNALNNFESQPIFKSMTIHKDFSVHNSPLILCDPIKLEQILYNLMKNAHDATEGKGEVWIRDILESHQICIEFEDNGPGVPEEMLDKIFSPFLTTKATMGTGLGLSISQQIIQQHGGTFSVYNKANSGACFQMTFPILRQPTAQASA